MKTKTNVMKKVLGFVLTLVIMCSMLPMTSNAAAGQTFYVAPNANWQNKGGENDLPPRYAAYFFDASGNTWVDMTAVEGTTYYKVTVPADNWTTMIFCRMSPDTAENNWNAGVKWNQTSDLKIADAGTNCLYTVAADTWDKGGGTWGHAYTDGVCTLCGAYEDGIGAKLAGYSLTVDGKIGVNFYMELADTVLADDTAYMQFTLPDGTTPKVYVNEVKETPKTEGGKPYYVFTCKVAAKEMASDIKAKIVTGTGEGTEYTFTVRDYADALIARSSSDPEKAKLVAFVKAMLNYGAASQTYFGCNASDLANKHSDSQTITAYTATELADFKPVITDNGSVLSNVKANLVLESGTKLNVKFTAAADATIKLNGNDVSATGTDYVIAIDDLNATELDKVQTVTVNTATIACSPLSYCYSVLATSNDANLKNVVCALYDYNKAADAYIK